MIAMTLDKVQSFSSITAFFMLGIGVNILKSNKIMRMASSLQ